jgi:16S rRNA (cytidine1402-2'-O)-methyltransferase
MTSAIKRGTLYLVPAPLDFGCGTLAPLTDALPLATLQVAAKTTRAVLKRVGEVLPLAVTIQQQTITELPREVHKKGDHLAGSLDAMPLLQAALQGHDIGLISEAGMPAIADPGSSVVRAAHALGISVVPLVGPCSLLLALAASGLNGQNFAFVGYLPQDAEARVQRIKALEALAIKTGQTQLFIETPYRNAAVWEALLKTLAPGTRVSVSSGLTLATAVTRSALVKEHRAAYQHADAMPALAAPCVFGLGV